MGTIFDEIFESFRVRAVGGQPVKIIGLEFQEFMIVVIFHDVGSPWNIQCKDFPYYYHQFTSI